MTEEIREENEQTIGKVFGLGLGGRFIIRLYRNLPVLIRAALSLLLPGCLSQADRDITEINNLTAEAIQTPLKSVKSEYFSFCVILFVYVYGVCLSTGKCVSVHGGGGC